MVFHVPYAYAGLLPHLALDRIFKGLARLDEAC